jgi:glucose-6-phosphate 1-epimerase
MIDSLVLSEHVNLESGPGGLPCLRLRGKGGSAKLLLHGAHLLEFVPEGGDPVLWTSEQSQFEHGKPVRGGIPVCWPWLGPHGSDSTLPAHGVARLRAWTGIDSELLEDGRVRVRLGFTPAGNEWDVVPTGLRAEITVTVGNALEVSLDSINEGDDPVEIEDALHAYFALSQIEDSVVKGLEGAEYLDKMDGMNTKTQSGPIRFESETDRVYQDADGSVELLYEHAGRTIRLDQFGAANRVIWNPWIDKSAAMPDFGNEEWRGMCCVETANCLQNRLRIPPGKRHRTTLLIY